MSLSTTIMNLTTSAYEDTRQTAIRNNGVTVALCITINYVNSILVHTFRKHQVFNTNPRYILYIHLVINDMSLLIMFTILQLLSYTVLTINVSVCMVLLMISIIFNLNNPLTLAAMAVECYIAVCFPFRHNQICTVQKTYVGIGLIWTLNTLSIVPDLFVIWATESREFVHSRRICARENVFRHPSLTVKRDVCNTVFLVIVWLTILYTYFRILFTAKAAAADAKKARNTVLLHGFQLMLCMLNYVYNLLVQGLSYLFPKDAMTVRFSITIFFSVLPRVITPVIYGLRDKTFRKYLKLYFLTIRSSKSHLQIRPKELRQ